MFSKNYANDRNYSNRLFFMIEKILSVKFTSQVEISKKIKHCQKFQRKLKNLILI